MTALPLRDFSDAERAKLAAIEAAPAADESVRERVARAMYAADSPDPLPEGIWPQIPYEAETYLPMADAALAVLSGPSSDAEQAVERCLALADELQKRASRQMAESRMSNNPIWKRQRSAALARLADVDLLRAVINGQAATC